MALSRLRRPRCPRTIFARGRRAGRRSITPRRSRPCPNTRGPASRSILSWGSSPRRSGRCPSADAPRRIPPAWYRVFGPSRSRRRRKVCAPGFREGPSLKCRRRIPRFPNRRCRSSRSTPSCRIRPRRGTYRSPETCASRRILPASRRRRPTIRRIRRPSRSPARATPRRTRTIPRRACPTRPHPPGCQLGR